MPLSPWISTVARDGATCRIKLNTSSIHGACPMIFSKPNFLSNCRRSCRFSSSNCRDRRARWSTNSNWSRLTGLVIKSYAPVFMASTAVSIVPYAVSKIQIRLASRSKARPLSVTPSIPDIRISVIITSTLPCSASTRKAVRRYRQQHLVSSLAWRSPAGVFIFHYQYNRFTPTARPSPLFADAKPAAQLTA